MSDFFSNEVTNRSFFKKCKKLQTRPMLFQSAVSWPFTVYIAFVDFPNGTEVLIYNKRQLSTRL